MAIKEDILKAKLLINKQILLHKKEQQSPNDKEFSKFYLFTNENVNYYLRILELENVNNALTVLSSGDQLFNLITKGINDIDTFDINQLTYYYALGFKRAMILKYSYQDFIDIYKKMIMKSNINLNDLINSLLPYMDEDHKLFWQELIDYIYNVQKKFKNPINIIKLLSYFNVDNNIFLSNNNYLISEENYNTLRNKISNANITFTHTNAVCIDETLNKKYDLIILSNILDYFYQEYERVWDYEDLLDYEKKLESISNNNALLILHYIFSYYGGRSDYIDPLIDHTTINNMDFSPSNILVVPHSIKHFLSFNDGIILKKIKK